MAGVTRGGGDTWQRALSRPATLSTWTGSDTWLTAHLALLRRHLDVELLDRALERLELRRLRLEIADLLLARLPNKEAAV